MSVRIATVKATGHKYIVIRLAIETDPAKSRAFCWGELSSYKGLGSKHGPSKTFLLSAVDVEEVPKTIVLLEELFHQMLDAKRKEGYQITRTRGGNYRIVGKVDVARSE